MNIIRKKALCNFYLALSIIFFILSFIILIILIIIIKNNNDPFTSLGIEILALSVIPKIFFLFLFLGILFLFFYGILKFLSNIYYTNQLILESNLNQFEISNLLYKKLKNKN